MNEKPTSLDFRGEEPRFSRQWSSGAPPAGSSIGTRSPPPFLGAAQSRRSAVLQAVSGPHSVHIRAPAARPPRPPASSGVRACGAVARLTPWIESGIGSAVRATNGSLGLGRSPPDPHPPSSRMRCDGFVRSARSLKGCSQNVSRRDRQHGSSPRIAGLCPLGHRPSVPTSPAAIQHHLL